MHTGRWITPHWLAMANYSITLTPTHTHVRATDRLQWRGAGDRGRGLSWVVVSCHDAEMCFWTWAIFQRGERGSSSQPPPLTPSLHGDVSTFSENQHGPKYVRGSSNKIYRWGHKTPFMRGGRATSELSCHTDQTKHLCPYHSGCFQARGRFD